MAVTQTHAPTHCTHFRTCCSQDTKEETVSDDFEMLAVNVEEDTNVAAVQEKPLSIAKADDGKLAAGGNTLSHFLQICSHTHTHTHTHTPTHTHTHTHTHTRTCIHTSKTHASYAHAIQNTLFFSAPSTDNSICDIHLTSVLILYPISHFLSPCVTLRPAMPTTNSRAK